MNIFSGHDARPQGVRTVEPLLEGRPLLGQVLVEHGPTQVGQLGVVEGEALGPAVHGDRQLLAGQMGRARRPAGPRGAACAPTRGPELNQKVPWRK